MIDEDLNLGLCFPGQFSGLQTSLSLPGHHGVLYLL
jgi:hypothetical protein